MWWSWGWGLMGRQVKILWQGILSLHSVTAAENCLNVWVINNVNSFRYECSEYSYYKSMLKEDKSFRLSLYLLLLGVTAGFESRPSKYGSLCVPLLPVNWHLTFLHHIQHQPQDCILYTFWGYHSFSHICSSVLLLAKTWCCLLCLFHRSEGPSSLQHGCMM